MPRLRTPFTAIALALSAAVPAAVVAAQQARLENARVATQPAGTPFLQSMRTLVSQQKEAAWIGYTVPVVSGDRTMCCYDGGGTFVNGTIVSRDGPPCCASCRLEPASSASMSTRPAQPGAGVVRLEGSVLMTVLLRAAEGNVERVRVFSEDCRLDAGGRTVIWVENVRPAESIAYLESLVAAGKTERRVTEGAISAIALHADAAADASLERLVADGQPEQVRRAVPFWLGNTRGRRGLDVLRRLVKEDQSVEVRKKAVFGISQSEEAPAIDVLIDTARHNDRTAVRGDAVFWLSQKAGRKAAAAITERIEQDPETEVKKRAVFALSQLPKDEGVPLLIGVARHHSNPAVRKQAMFWLGQSRDPRAIEFFAEILK